MLLLTSTSDKIQVVTGSAVDVEVHASFMDYNGTTVTPGRTNTAISTATTTDVVAAPGSGVQRNIKVLHIRNVHASSSVAVTVVHTDGSVAVDIAKVTMAAGERLSYTEDHGFSYFAADGTVKTGANAAIDALSADLAAETSNRVSADNALSNQISVVSNAVSVVSQAVSLLSNTNSVEHAALSVRIDTQSQAVSVLSQQVSVLSQAHSVLSQAHSALSQAVSVISTTLSNEASVRSAADAGLSTRIDTQSQAVSVLSQQVSVLSQAHSALSQAVSVMSNTLSNEISARAASVQTASAAATSADGHAATASAAATSVDGRVNSVNTFLSSISARSVGNVSTHGLQSVINALSNRISAAGGAGSVTSNELSAVSAQAASAINVVSADLATLSLAVSALSTNVSTLSAKVVSVSAQLVSVDGRVNSVNTFLSGISARSAGVSTHGLQSVINALSTRIDNAGGGGSVTSTEVSAVSAQAASADSVIRADLATLSLAVSALSTNVSTLSAKVVSVSAQLVSVDGRVNSVNTFLSGISARSVGNVSTHGLQSVIGALQNRIQIAENGISVVSANLATLSLSVSAISTALSNEMSVRSAADAALSIRINNVPGGGSTPANAIKATSHIISQVALTNINSLLVSVSAGCVYKIDGGLFVVKAGAAQPVKAGVTFPALARGSGLFRVALSAVPTTGAAYTATVMPAWHFKGDASGSIIVSTVSTAAVSIFIEFEAFFVVSTTGVVRLQVGASTGATGQVIVERGSFMRITKIGSAT